MTVARQVATVSVTEKKMTHYKYKITHVYFDALFYMSIQVQFINLSYVWIIKRATGAEMTVETYRQ